MSTPKHTSGPWQLVKAGKRINQLNIIGRNDRWVTDAHPFNKGKEPTEEMIANARLIAASPELLGLAKDGALQFARLEGESLIAYARTFAALADRLIDKATKGEAE